MSEKETNFISHLTELRQRLINSLIFLAVFLLLLFFSDHIYGFLLIRMLMLLKMMVLKED